MLQQGCSHPHRENRRRSQQSISFVVPWHIVGSRLDFERQDDHFQASFFAGNLTIVHHQECKACWGFISSKSVFKNLNESAALPRREMVCVYGLETSQKCSTPACTAVELVALAVSSAGRFSLLVAFELPASSKRGGNHLVFLPCW